MDKNLLVLLLIIPIAIIGGDSYLNAKKRKTDIMTMEAAIKQANDKIGEANAAKQKIPDEREALTKLKSNYQIVMRALPKQEEAEGLLKQTIPIADKWIQFTELSPVIKKRESMTVTTSAGKPAVEYDQVAMKMAIRSSLQTTVSSVPHVGRFFSLLTEKSAASFLARSLERLGSTPKKFKKPNGQTLITTRTALLSTSRAPIRRVPS